MTIPYITKQQTLKLIDRLPSTDSKGYDEVTNNIIKSIKWEIEPIITHLINRIIATEIFPKIYKLSRILPLSKPKKNILDIESYRPINNMAAVEKIIEQYLQECINKHYDINNVLIDSHHGGRKKHSTKTAITNIYHELINNKELTKTSILFCTDLSAAYDTVDHEILLRKLEHMALEAKFIT